MTVASVYPLYLAKVEKKGRTRDELDAVIRWLTGYDEPELAGTSPRTRRSRTSSPEAQLNPDAALITGVICGVRVEAIDDPLMQQIRYLDKLVDELAKGRPLEKVLRSASSDPRPSGAGPLVTAAIRPGPAPADRSR